MATLKHVCSRIGSGPFVLLGVSLALGGVAIAGPRAFSSETASDRGAKQPFSPVVLSSPTAVSPSAAAGGRTRSTSTSTHTTFTRTHVTTKTSGSAGGAAAGSASRSSVGSGTLSHDGVDRGGLRGDATLASDASAKPKPGKPGPAGPQGPLGPQGAGPAEVLPNTRVGDSGLTATGWSPDGSKLVGAMMSDGGRPTGIGVYDLAAKTVRRVSDDHSYAARWLCDSRRVVYFVDEGQRLAVLDTVTGARKVFDVRLAGGVTDNMFAISLVSAVAPSKPSRIPMVAATTPWRRTIRKMSPDCAPSAMRSPNSRMRSVVP